MTVHSSGRAAVKMPPVPLPERARVPMVVAASGGRPRTRLVVAWRQTRRPLVVAGRVTAVEVLDARIDAAADVGRFIA